MFARKCGAKSVSLAFMTHRGLAGSSKYLATDHELKGRLVSNFEKLIKLSELSTRRSDTIVVSDFLAARVEDQKRIYISDDHASELVGFLNHCGVPCKLQTKATEAFGQGSETTIAFKFKASEYGGLPKLLKRISVKKASEAYASSLPLDREAEDIGIVIE